MKLKAAKSSLKEAGSVPANPEQEEGDAIQLLGRDLGIAVDTKHQVTLCGHDLNLWLQITKCNLIAAISAPKPQ